MSHREHGTSHSDLRLESQSPLRPTTSRTEKEAHGIFHYRRVDVG